MRTAEPTTEDRSRTGERVALALSALLAVLGVVWLVGLQGSSDTPESTGSSLSTGPQGAAALYRWLERSGFQVSRVGAGQPFPPDAGTLFMINPNEDFPQGQAGSVLRWVEDGHTLVLALSSRSGDPSTGLRGRHPMLRALGVDLVPSPAYSSTVPVAQPLFTRPPLSQVTVPGVFSLDLPLTGTVVLASAKGANGGRLPLAAMMRLGKGQAIVLSSNYPLSNQGLRAGENAAFVYNLAQMAGGRRVAFDEAHHGVSTGGDLVGILTSNPWGWALIYAALLAGAYFLWSARRLGPPLPVRAPDERRPTSDYVRSAAGLFRRSRKPGYAAERYLQFFKRTLSRYAELDPFLTDARFVQSLAERGRHSFNQDEMLKAIERLRALEGVGEGSRASESAEMETLRAVRDAERLRRQAMGLADGTGEG